MVKFRVWDDDIGSYERKDGDRYLISTSGNLLAESTTEGCNWELHDDPDLHIEFAIGEKYFEEPDREVYIGDICISGNRVLVIQGLYGTQYSTKEYFRLNTPTLSALCIFDKFLGTVREDGHILYDKEFLEKKVKENLKQYINI